MLSSELLEEDEDEEEVDEEAPEPSISLSVAKIKQLVVRILKFRVKSYILLIPESSEFPHINLKCILMPQCLTGIKLIAQQIHIQCSVTGSFFNLFLNFN